MKRLEILILLVFSNTFCFSQSKIEIDSIKLISFDFQQSRRLYYHNVHVNLKGLENTAEMHVKSTPACRDKKCLKTAIDTVYVLPLDDFNEIKNSVFKISLIDMEAAQADGFDGVSCSVGFGDGKKWVWYQVWSPYASTKQRDLEAYVDACKLIIKKAKLKYRKILN